ncbi:hypothetical protein LJC23_06255 [Desulfovibrio sp. OttesenSCG-928-I05]|nr:hypothetical protein [Desulfovibrio sp. OttesenSCG-928-I05]
MLQRNIISISRLRTRFRPLTPFLYFFLIVSLTWYESAFSPAPHSFSSSATVAEHSDDDSTTAVNQGSASRRLPSVLTPGPKLPSGSKLRPDNRDDELPPIQLCWAIAGEPFNLPSLRIEPVVWDSGTPSFLLPSAYGLVPFAIPPPSGLA